MTLTYRRLLALGKRLHTDDGMLEFMNGIFGSGGWVYDEDDQLWIALDTKYQGAGRSYYLVRRGGNWTKAIVPDEALS